jgi:hypothetical protein
MISVKYLSKILLFFCLPILCCATTFLSSVASAELLQEEKSKEILKQLVFTDNESEIVKKWELYLKESTWFNDEVHQLAIIQPGLQFASSVSALSDCLNSIEQNKKKYSSEWVKGFHKKFDNNYVKNNFDSIRFVISYVFARDVLKYCEEQKKEALYREIIYRQAFEDYIQHLQRFSETLDTKERKKVADRLTVAKTLLEGPPYPLQLLLSPGKERLFVIAFKARKDLDPMLIDFFSTDPFFQKPFDPTKVVNDLEALALPQASD